MVLRTGQKKDENRSIISGMIGKRGQKYLGKANEFSHATPSLSENDLQVAEMAEEAGRTMKGSVTNFGVGLSAVLRNCDLQTGLVMFNKISLAG